MPHFPLPISLSHSKLPPTSSIAFLPPFQTTIPIFTNFLTENPTISNSKCLVVYVTHGYDLIIQTNCNLNLALVSSLDTLPNTMPIDALIHILIESLSLVMWSSSNISFPSMPFHSPLLLFNSSLSLIGPFLSLLHTACTLPSYNIFSYPLDPYCYCPRFPLAITIR